jgi:Na+-transporting methylmalonyl-CoA/oxaloacetate decarboxylase gamma subunit
VSFIAKILRLFESGLTIVFEGGIVVVAKLSILSSLVPGFGRLRMRRGTAKDYEDEEKSRERLKRALGDPEER